MPGRPRRINLCPVPGQKLVLPRIDDQSDTIEISENEHLDDSYARCINHSSSPNLEVHGRKLVALRDIATGDEVTFNYLENESEIASPFVCHETGDHVNSDRCLAGRPRQGT